MFAHAVSSNAFLIPIFGALVLVVAMFVAAARYNTTERKIYGGSWRPLLTTALTLPGVLLTISAGALVYVAQQARIADAGLLLAGMSLYPIVLVLAVWVLAGTVKYTAADTDTVTFAAGKAWPYIGAFGAIYILLVLAITLTASFFVFRSALLMPVALQPSAEDRALVMIARQPIRVGDSRALVLALWGRPDSVRRSPSTLFYSGRAGVITVSLDPTQVVESITLGGDR
jgi:hypothetical protein